MLIKVNKRGQISLDFFANALKIATCRPAQTTIPITKQVKTALEDVFYHLTNREECWPTSWKKRKTQTLISGLELLALEGKDS
jgi:hypothetical protein